MTSPMKRLQVRHHSAVGLVDRLVQRGLAERVRRESDRRHVLVRLTPRASGFWASWWPRT